MLRRSCKYLTTERENGSGSPQILYALHLVCCVWANIISYNNPPNSLDDALHPLPLLHGNSDGPVTKILNVVLFHVISIEQHLFCISEGSVLIFVTRKLNSEELTQNLKKNDFERMFHDISFQTIFIQLDLFNDFIFLFVTCAHFLAGRKSINRSMLQKSYIFNFIYFQNHVIVMHI